MADNREVDDTLGKLPRALVERLTRPSRDSHKSRRPRALFSLVAGGALLAGIGFTMALFIANLAFSPDMIGEAKLGIFVASVVSAAAGLLLLRTSSRSFHGFTPDA
jgi:ABC-type Fe3+-siderophore transport system permease subunit